MAEPVDFHRPAEMPADAVEVGRILDAWGVKGWFKVQAHSASAEALFSSRRWFLRASERGSPAFAGAREMVIAQVREHGGNLVASSEAIAERGAAEALRGCRIFISRSAFPKPGPDEFYWVDLIGLAVVNREGVCLGEVKDLLATGPQTVLVLHAAENGQMMERLIPFVSAFVDSVDLAGRRIVVDWQPDF